jgi:hypothetical protein
MSFVITAPETLAVFAADDERGSRAGDAAFSPEPVST